MKLKLPSFHSFLLWIVLAWALPSNALAQGCSLCRDATAGSAPQARRAFRRAIPLLAIPALGIFAVTLMLARSIRPGDSPDETSSKT
jgi:hypothetical protein